jgi:hypothetical protein
MGGWKTPENLIEMPIATLPVGKAKQTKAKKVSQ